MALIEPSLSYPQSLIKDMPVLLTSFPFALLRPECIAYAPKLVVQSPTLQNDSTFFMYHNISVHFACVDLHGKGDLYSPKCSGLICDGKNTDHVTDLCGCFPQSKHTTPVIL